MQRISYFNFFLLSAIFLCSSIDTAPLIVPVSFRPSLSFKYLENDLITFKIADSITKNLVKIDALIKSHLDNESNFLLQRLRKLITHVSIDDIDSALAVITQIENRFLDVKESTENPFQYLRFGLFIKAILELCNQAHEVLIESIEVLEKNEEYWDRQYAYSYYHFLHRSPFHWFGKKSFKYEIMMRKKAIAAFRKNQEDLLGKMSFMLSKFNSDISIEEQFSWVKKNLVFISKICLKYPLNDTCIAQEHCVAVLKQLHNALNKRNYFIQKRIKDIDMPSHFERNWAVYAALVTAAIGGYWYIKRNPQALENGFKSVQNFLIKNYTNHLKEPLCDIKKALFVSNDEVNSAAQNLKKLISETKPSQETAEKLKKDYVEICTTIGNTLQIPVNTQELLKKAGELDQDYLDNLCQLIANAWKKGGLVVESYLNPFATTTKSKVLNVLPDLGILIYRVAKLTGRSLAINGGEILISRIDELERKLNLTVAAVSLLPAYFVITRAVMALRSFGGFLLPKGYDDTPIKNYVTKMHDLLDDIIYIDSQKTADGLEPALIGRLFYYSARVEEEALHLSQKNQIALKNLLEKFYITNDLKGKHLYLEKILHEYHSWPRFIQP